MQGGFRQDDGTFLCANCVINLVEKNSNIFALEKAKEICDRLLIPGYRMKKSEVRTLRSWIKVVIDRAKKTRKD